jgi:hypothetical protein
MSVRITADDFFAGLFAVLAQRERMALSIRVDQFDSVLATVFERLRERAGDDVNLRFRIRTHPMHRDSPTVQDALGRAAQRDLISFNNPEYQDITIKLASDEATRILENLPGGTDLYKQVADDFLEVYAAPQCA